MNQSQRSQSIHPTKKNHKKNQSSKPVPMVILVLFIQWKKTALVGENIMDEYTDEKKREIAQNKLCGWHWMRENGFTLDNIVTRNSPLMGTPLALEFVNRSFEILISFSFYIYKDSPIGSFGILIKNLSADKGKKFCLGDFFKVKKLYFDWKKMELHFYNEKKYEDKIDQFLAYLETLFEQPELNAFLTGKKWEAIPFSGNDYK